jgi:hypothetical protein
MTCFERSRKIAAWILASMVVFALSVDLGWSQIGGQPETWIVPQIAAGSFDNGQTTYSTVTQIINPTVVSLTISGMFFNVSGNPSSLVLVTNSTAQPTISNGTLNTIVLDPGKVLTISAGTIPALTPAVGTLAWGKIFAGGSVSIVTYIEIRNGLTGALLSRVGVPASFDNLARFVIPRIRNATTGLDVGFALVNTVSAVASVTVTLKDASGAVLGIRTITVPGLGHVSVFAQELFQLSNEPSVTTYQYMVFDSNNAFQFAAVAIAYEGTTQTSVPVDVFQ